MGILTLNHGDHCLSVTTNQILCAFEASIGVLIIVLLLREIRRVFALLQVIIVLHTLQTLCVITICVLSLAEVDPTIEIKYALYSLAHAFFAYAVSGRLFVLARVVYMSAAPQKFISPLSLLFLSPVSLSSFSLLFLFSLSSYL